MSNYELFRSNNDNIITLKRLLQVNRLQQLEYHNKITLLKKEENKIVEEIENCLLLNKES